MPRYGGVKVLLLASTFPSSDTDAAPAFVKDLAIALKRTYADLHIDVLAPHYLDETASFAQREHYAEHRFSYFWPASQQKLAGRGIVPAIESNRALLAQVPFLFAGEGLALLRHVQRTRPDVLYAHWFTPQGVMAALVGRATGVPWVLTSHANDVRIWKKLPVAGKRIVRTLLPTAKRITAVSAATRDKMRAFFDDDEWRRIEERVAIVPMGVDVDGLAAPARTDVGTLKREHGCAGRDVVYFVGRLAEKKGVSFLLEAFARMDRTMRPLLVVAGDGPLRGDLEERARSLGLRDGDDVRFVGYVTGQTKLDWLQLADVVVVPSIETKSGDSEGFPLVVMEALAAGKPCVASDATGADSVLVDGVSGFVVPQKNAPALASAVERALKLDDNERRALAERARSAARALDWQTIARRTYEHLLAPFA